MSFVKMEISEAVLIPPEGSEIPDEPVIIEPPKRIERVRREPVVPSPPEPKRERSTNITNGYGDKISELINNSPYNSQKLEEKAQKAQEALEKEEKARKELEALNSKLLAEKTALLDSLSGEKGALQDYQEKCAKLTAQKNDLDNQLRVSSHD